MLNFKPFIFDGQTIAIEDYDRIKPENAEKLKKYIFLRKKNRYGLCNAELC